MVREPNIVATSRVSLFCEPWQENKNREYLFQPSKWSILHSQSKIFWSLNISYTYCSFGQTIKACRNQTAGCLLRAICHQHDINLDSVIHYRLCNNSMEVLTGSKLLLRKWVYFAIVQRRFQLAYVISQANVSVKCLKSYSPGKSNAWQEQKNLYNSMTIMPLQSKKNACSKKSHTDLSTAVNICFFQALRTNRLLQGSKSGSYNRQSSCYWLFTVGSPETFTTFHIFQFERIHSLYWSLLSPRNSIYQ